MNVLDELPAEVPPDEYAEAAGELKEAYDDMQATLRLPWVAFGVRSLAVFGGYVPVAWRAAKPGFETRLVTTGSAGSGSGGRSGPRPPTRGGERTWKPLIRFGT